MSRPLRIAHLAFSALPATVGGLEVVVDSVIRHQQALGHQATLVTRWKQWGAFQREDYPYRALPLPPRPNTSPQAFSSVGQRWPVAAAARWHQWRHRFDVWHIHWLYPTGWMVHDALVRAGVPVVMTPHGADIQVDLDTRYGFRQFPRHDRRVRELVPKAGALTAISASIERSLLELGADPSHVVRIPNGVDAARIKTAREKREAARARLGVGSGTAIVISVGRNEPRKGFQFVPATLARLIAQGRSVCWIIVGSGTEALNSAMEAANVGSHVRLLPPVRGEMGSHDFPPDELAEFYAAADVFAFPSMKEGFGMVLLEAMAAGTPVVGNDVSGIRDVIVDGVDGVLCRPRDPEAMANAIGRVLDDPALAASLSNAGLAKAAAHDWPIVTQQYLDLYRSLIAETRA